MVGKAKSIAHGINALNYITGESQNKKHPDKIFRICDRNLPEGLDATGIWHLFRERTEPMRLLRNNVIRIELSPPEEYTRDFTDADWRKLWDDFVREFDRIEYRDKHGKVKSPKTNLAEAMHTVWLHKDSEGRVPHLHCCACRVDEAGHTINDHFMPQRAIDAANAVARKRGWKTAMDFRAGNMRQVCQDCEAVLKAMPKWDFTDYAARLERLGYKVCPANPDKNGVIHGYALVKGNAKYKASGLTGRKFTMSKLPHTWQKLHPTNETTMRETERQTKHNFKPKPVQDYTQRRNGTSPFTIRHEGEDYRCFIPDKAMKVWNDEFDHREWANWSELTNLAAAVFVGLLSLDNNACYGGVGGGGGNEPPARGKDDDDEWWARRCARYAAWWLGKKKKRGLNR